MGKFSKYYKYSPSIIMGLVFIVFGIVILVGMEELYRDIISLLVLVFLVISLFSFLKFLAKKKDNSSLFSCLFNLLLSIIFVLVPNISLGMIPFLFSIYLLLISGSNLVMYILFLKNNGKHRFSYLFNFLFYFLIAIPVMFNPIRNGKTFIIFLAVYLMLLGIGCIRDFVVGIIPNKTKNKLKRRIRITLPKILEAIIPYSVLRDINKALEVNSEYNYSVSKGDKSDIDVIIHISDRGFNKAGHIDIHYKGKVYSYGNYDEGSRKAKEMFGDGVLFTCNNIKDYINFCIDNSKKTVFVFGIKLNDEQDKRVSDKIKDLMNNVYSWDYKSDKKYNNGDSYASKLYKKTKAKFYKFNSGKYRVYFVFGYNCCYLVDDILAKSGMEILSLNGIVTPGTYYNYLDSEINKKNSRIISKEIYNDKRRP